MKFSRGKKIIHFLSVQFAFIFRVFFFFFFERERVAVKEDITGEAYVENSAYVERYSKDERNVTFLYLHVNLL